MVVAPAFAYATAVKRVAAGRCPAFAQQRGLITPNQQAVIFHNNSHLSMTSRFALSFTFALVINLTPSARSQAVIDSAAVLNAAFGEIGPIMLFNKSYFLAMDRWPKSLVDIDGFASKNDSLFSSWTSVRKKFSSVKFVITRGDTLIVYFELAPFTQDSLIVNRAKGIMKMLPGPPDRPGCMIIAIEFTDIEILDGSRQPRKR